MLFLINLNLAIESVSSLELARVVASSFTLGVDLPSGSITQTIKIILH